MQYRTLESLCKIASGGTPSRSKKEYWDGGDVPWIKIGNIKSKVVSNADEYITEAGLNNSSAKLFKKGTILYTIFATLGEVGILDFDACTNQAIAGVSIEKPEEITADYLYYYLKSKKAEVNKIGRGVAQNNINLSILRKFLIPMRAIEEQKTIVNSLNKIESIIEKQKQQLEQLNNLIKARFVEMFGGIDRYISIKDSGLFIADGNYSSKYPRSSEFTSFGVPFIRANNIKDNTVVDDDMYFISPEKHDELKKGHLLHGDILVTTRGNIGQLGIVPQKHNNSNINAQIVLLRCRDTKYLPEYLLFALQTVDVKKQFIRQQTGTALKQLPVKHLEKISFIDAPIELQNQFATFVTQVDKSKFALSNELAMGNFYIRLIHDCIMHGCIDLRVPQ